MGSYVDLVLSPWWLIGAVVTFAALVGVCWISDGTPFPKPRTPDQEDIRALEVIRAASPLLARIMYALAFDPAITLATPLIFLAASVTMWPPAALVAALLVPQAFQRRARRHAEGNDTSGPSFPEG